jgi:hypothetical protein
MVTFDLRVMEARMYRTSAAVARLPPFPLALSGIAVVLHRYRASGLLPESEIALNSSGAFRLRQLQPVSDLVERNTGNGV